MTPAAQASGMVRITDHYNVILPIDLAGCTFHGRALRPGYLDETPARLGSDWIVERLKQGRSLEVWRRRDGIWFVVDPADSEGVVVNRDQRRDLLAQRQVLQFPSPFALTLETRNFRVLRQTHWTPSGVCALVGPNGAGKTTLLTLLKFLRSAYLRGAPSALDDIGGVYGLRSWGAPEEEPVSVALTIGDLRWELQLSAQGPTLSGQLGERVTRGDETIVSRAPMSSRLHDSTEERGLAMGGERLALRVALEAEDVWEVASLISVITNTRVYRNYDLGGLKTHGSRQGGDLRLDPSGQNVITVLRNWRDRRDLRPQYEFVLAGLRSAFPDVFADLDFQVAGLTATADLIDPKSQRACPLSLAPDGWITGLLHLTAVAGAPENTLVAIDDFGNDLHPYAIHKLTEAFREWAEERDLIVCLASHSPVLLDQFKDNPESVFVMEHGQESRPVSLTELYDADWLARFSLGGLYAHGEFGGQRPRHSASPNGTRAQATE